MANPEIVKTPDNYREPDADLGASSRSVRFKKDTVNIHCDIFDENRGDDCVETYNKMMTQIGKYLRVELNITQADVYKSTLKEIKETIDEQSEDNPEDESLLNKAKGLLG